MIDPAMMGAPQGGPPQSIDIPAPEGDSGGGDPIAKVKEAQKLLREALAAEPDEQDSLLIEDILTKTQKYIADQEKMMDTAMGAGPGARVIRKAQGGGGGGY